MNEDLALDALDVVDGFDAYDVHLARKLDYKLGRRGRFVGIARMLFTLHGTRIERWLLLGHH